MKTLLEFEKKYTVEGKEITRKFGILKPSQSLKEEAEEFTAIEQSNLVRKGVLTRQMLRKRLLDGEIYSETEKQEITNLYDDYNKINSDLRETLSSEEKSEPKTLRIEELKNKLVELQTQIRDLELSQIALFDSTAEVIARNRTLFWWTLVLFLEEKNGKYTQMFTGRDYKGLKDQYDVIAEEDPLCGELFKEVSEMVTLWFLGVLNQKEDFKKHWENKIKEDLEEKQKEKAPVGEIAPTVPAISESVASV